MAPSFSVATGYVQLPTLPPTTAGGPLGSSFTIEAWVDYGYLQSNRPLIFSLGNAGADNDTLTLNYLYLALEYVQKPYLGSASYTKLNDNHASEDNDGWGVPRSVPPVKSYYHLVITSTATSATDTAVSFYINGALAAISSASGQTTVPNDVTRAANTVGVADNPDPNFFFSVSEFALYPTALSAARAAAHFSAGQTPVAGACAAGGAAYLGAVLADAPWGFWRLAETSGTVATDCSGNGRHAAYSGGLTPGGAGRGAGYATAGVAPAFGGAGYVTLPTVPNVSPTGGGGGGPFTTSYTIEAWLYYPSAPSTGARLFDIGKTGAAPQHNICVAFSGGLIAYQNYYAESTMMLANTDTNSSDVAAPAAGAYFHYAFVAKVTDW